MLMLAAIPARKSPVAKTKSAIRAVTTDSTYIVHRTTFRDGPAERGRAIPEPPRLLDRHARRGSSPAEGIGPARATRWIWHRDNRAISVPQDAAGLTAPAPVGLHPHREPTSDLFCVRDRCIVLLLSHS